MPYQLIPGEPVPAAIRRIVREEIESAARQLSGKGEPNRDEAIHEARKSIKKIRGVLRLMRPELQTTYRRENAWFRDLGQRLSHLRDATAMIEAFDALRDKYREEMGRHTLASIRRGLIARRGQHADGEDVLPHLAGELRDSISRVKEWPLAADGFEALAPGIEAAFRNGRKAMSRARKRASPENYHEWRKRVKDHWYHVRLLEKYWSGAIEGYEKSLKDLETWLGEDHNLVVLEATVLDKPALFGKPPDVALFVKLIGKYRKKLREDAVSLGKHIYGEKPRQLTKRFARLWDEGQPKKS